MKISLFFHKKKKKKKKPSFHKPKCNVFVFASINMKSSVFLFFVSEILDLGWWWGLRRTADSFTVLHTSRLLWISSSLPGIISTKGIQAGDS